MEDRYVPSHSSTFDMNPIYVGYYLKPTYSYHAGLSFHYNLKKWLSGSAGVQYFNRRESYYSEPDSVDFYENLYDREFPVTWKKSSNSIEAPVYIGFHIYRFSLNIGYKFHLISFRYSKDMYLNDSKKTYYEYFFFGNYRQFMFFSLKVSYLLFNKKHIYIYVSDEEGIYPRNDISVGVQFKM